MARSHCCYQSKYIVASLILALTHCKSASGQDFIWQNAAGGLWSDGVSWNMGTAPNGAGERAVLPDLGGPYAVTVDSSPMIGGVTIGSINVSANLISGRTLSIVGSGGVTNNGLLNVNDGQSSSNSRVRFTTDGALNGAGVLRLNSSSDVLDAQLDIDAGVTVTTDIDSTIAGFGSIDAVGTLVLHGLILADVPGQDLRVNGSVQMSTNGQIAGTTGVVVVREGLVTGGAFAGGVEVGRFGRVGGGTVMTGINGQRGATQGFLAAGGIDNNGEFVVNTDGVSGDATLLTEADTDSEIGGVGTIRLNALTSDLGDAQIGAQAGTTLTVGEGQTILGRGEIAVAGAVVMNGELRPGGTDGAPSEILATGDGSLTQGTSSITAFDIYSATEFDRLTGSSSTTIVTGGVLELRLRDNYVPAVGERFLLIDTATLNGGFAAVDSSIVGGRQFGISQSVDMLEAVWTCLADTNLDGQLTPADFTAWIGAFNILGLQCDQNGDAMCTPADFTAWIANYNTGCPQ